MINDQLTGMAKVGVVHGGKVQHGTQEKTIDKKSTFFKSSKDTKSPPSHHGSSGRSQRYDFCRCLVQHAWARCTLS
eukprot:s2119_g8.t1